MQEPGCDMPWEIYLDWLQDQGNEDLRVIDLAFLNSGYIFNIHDFDSSAGDGERFRNNPNVMYWVGGRYGHGDGGDDFGHGRNNNDLCGNGI
mgnify:CR=1 FL=1